MYYFTQPVGKKYRCCSCIATFNSKTDCSDHIQKNHKPQTIQTAIEVGKNFKYLNITRMHKYWP